MSDKFITGKTFISGEQVTADDLNNAVKGASPLVALTDDLTLTVTNSEITVKDGNSTSGVPLTKMKHIAAKSIIGNSSNTISAPTNIQLGSKQVLRCNSSNSALEPVNGEITIDADSGTSHEILLGETLTVTGGEGIDTSISSNTLTVEGEDATVSNKGVASFNTNDFSVSSGAVSIKSGGVSNDQLAGSIANGKLANDSVTVTTAAGSGLAGGGEVNLGASVSLSIPTDGVTQDMASFIDNTTGTMTLSGTAPRIILDDTGNTGDSPEINADSAGGNLLIKTEKNDSVITLQSKDDIICTTNGNSRLDIGQQVAKDAAGSANQAGIKVYNDIYATGDISADGDIAAFVSSDKRLKQDIKPIENALSKVNKLSGNTFKWKDCATYKGDDIGVIAQEVQEVFPSAVRERHDGYLKVDYTRLVPLLLESIKELSAKVQELESKSHTHGIK